MPDLFIANCTQQNQIANFRVIEETRVRNLEIPIGAQTKVPGNLSDKQIEDIIRQLRKYGARDVSEVGRDPNFIGLVFSINKPVTADRIRYTVIQNLEVLDEQGEQMRAAAAVATHQFIEQNMPRDERGKKPNLDELHMEVVEETSGQTRSGIDRPHKPVAAGVKVNRAEDNTGTITKPTGAKKPRARNPKKA